MAVHTVFSETLAAEPARFGVRAADAALPETITRAASAQTYYTVRFLVDRGRVTDAYRAYAYFRWLDDALDGETMPPQQRLDVVARQQWLVNALYQGAEPGDLRAEERMLADLVHGDPNPASGLRSYIDNMMRVMAFDAERRGRLVSVSALDAYTLALATAVTEALHYFIGHDRYAPTCDARYRAVSAAHITHMLRDAHEDAAAGYYNIPREVIEAHGIAPDDFESAPYRAWVRERVEQARADFAAGRAYLAQVECLRCRLAGYAYMARFEGVLAAIERDGYLLRADYHECRSAKAYLLALIHDFIGLG
jgi:phytoene/squalene synthetase